MFCAANRYLREAVVEEQAHAQRDYQPQSVAQVADVLSQVSATTATTEAACCAVVDTVHHVQLAGSAEDQSSVQLSTAVTLLGEDTLSTQSDAPPSTCAATQNIAAANTPTEQRIDAGDCARAAGRWHSSQPGSDQQTLPQQSMGSGLLQLPMSVLELILQHADLLAVCSAAAACRLMLQVGCSLIPLAPLLQHLCIEASC